MDLQKAILTQFNQKVDDGTLHKIVGAHVEAYIKDLVKDVLSSYGDPSKALKDKISKEFISSLDRFSIQQYNSVVVELIQKELDKNYVGVVKTQLEQQFKKMFDVPTFTKFSQFWDKFKEAYEDEAPHDRVERASFFCDDDHKHLAFIYFDHDTKKEKYECEWSLYVDKETQQIISCSKRDLYGKRKILSAKLESMSELEFLIFQMISMGTKLEMDFDYCEDSCTYKWANY